MTLKRTANIVSAIAGTVLVVGGIVFLIVSAGQSNDPVEEDRILNVGIRKESSESDRGLSVFITVNPEGEFIIDDEVMPDEELLKKLKTMARIAADVDVRIRGTDNTSWDAMIRAVDLIETTGLTNVTFATNTPPPEQPSSAPVIPRSAQ